MEPPETCGTETKDSYPQNSGRREKEVRVEGVCEDIAAGNLARPKQTCTSKSA
jgi:hypothetical protein